MIAFFFTIPISRMMSISATMLSSAISAAHPGGPVASRG
jgi:hypothetical protein